MDFVVRAQARTSVPRGLRRSVPVGEFKRNRFGNCTPALQGRGLESCLLAGYRQPNKRFWSCGGRYYQSNLHDSDSFTPASRRSVGSSNRLVGANLAFADGRNVCVTQLTYNSNSLLYDHPPLTQGDQRWSSPPMLPDLCGSRLVQARWSRPATIDIPNAAGRSRTRSRAASRRTRPPTSSSMAAKPCRRWSSRISFLTARHRGSPPTSTRSIPRSRSRCRIGSLTMSSSSTLTKASI